MWAFLVAAALSTDAEDAALRRLSLLSHEESFSVLENQAESFFQEFPDSPSRSSVHALLGQKALSEKAYERAAQLFQEAGGCEASLSCALYHCQKYAEVVALEGASPLWKAKALIELKQDEAALRLLESQCSFSENAEPLYGLYTKIGEVDKAADILLALAQQDEAKREAWTVKAASLLLEKRPERAIQLLAPLQLKSDSANLLMGQLCLRLNRSQEALSYFQAIQIPTEASCLGAISAALQERNLTSAQEKYAQLKATFPDCVELAKIEPYISTLEKELAPKEPTLTEKMSSLPASEAILHLNAIGSRDPLYDEACIIKAKLLAQEDPESASTQLEAVIARRKASKEPLYLEAALFWTSLQENPQEAARKMRLEFLRQETISQKDYAATWQRRPELGQIVRDYLERLANSSEGL